jgi:hypothetical protein
MSEHTVLEGLTVKVRKADNGEWLWTAYARNGRKVATTGETYKDREHAERMAGELFPTAEIITERSEETK